MLTSGPGPPSTAIVTTNVQLCSHTVLITKIMHKCALQIDDEEQNIILTAILLYSQSYFNVMDKKEKRMESHRRAIFEPLGPILLYLSI